MSRSFLTLIAIAVAVVSSVDSHATDRTALLAFKSGVRGNLSGWGSPKMCNWTGVTCDSTERVAHLLLNNCNLSGVISPAIGNLSALKTLDLRFNQLSGIIPPELGMLSHLLVLRLSYNSLTGSIPEAVVCNCTSLTSIALSFNSLTGKIPFSARCRLPRLQHLSLHENRLQGNIPLSMSNFTSLSSVFLHYNSLGGVLPSQMFNKMPSLQYLYLSFNNFSSDGGNTNLEPFLASLVNCTRLQELGLESNGLGGEIPAMIGNLSSTNLSELYLDDNKITGAIPRAIGNLSALKTLDLRFNQLSGIIPPELGMLSQLLVLGLGHNSLTGSIPEAVICNCTSLTSIALSSNSLTGEIPFSAGCQLQRLQHLGLYENKLEGGIPLSMSNFTSLSWVLLQSNHLGGVLPSQMFNKMTSLQYLHLSGNNFSSDSGNTDLEPFLASLVNCTGLQELGLKSNGLGGEIPAIIGNLSSANLSELYLDSNEITGAIPRTIGNLASLTYLQLQNNMLEGPIPSEVFHPRGLTGIVLSNNQINGEIPKSISLAQKLSIIRISNSGLRGAIPETLSNLTLLDYLVLDHNQLSGAIPPGLSCRLILDLSYNKLTGQIPIGLARLSSFQMYLNLSNNLLEGPLTLEFGNMEMIQALDLSGNKLSGGLPSSIGTLKNLHFLDVSFNSLTGTIPQSLQGLPLQFANFSHNNFTGEVCSGGSFANLTDDSFLGNPGLCGSIPGMAPCISRKHGRFLYIAIVVVAAVAVGLLAMVCVVLDHYLMKGRLRLTAAPSSQLSRFPTGLVNATGEKESGEHHPRISYWELVDATDGFSEANLIGKGGYGHVYRGVLHDETAIAVKVLRQDHAAGEVVAGSFERECRVLRSIRHRNLIRVITACSTPEFKAVVLPFMPNGSLETLIHGPPSSGAGGGKPARLDLDLLLSVASNVAEGMAYLHHHAPVRVVHCDLKPSNVLLDANFRAKLADFGLARFKTPDAVAASGAAGDDFMSQELGEAGDHLSTTASAAGGAKTDTKDESGPAGVWGKEWWWKQDGSVELDSRDYVAEWIGSQICPERNPDWADENEDDANEHKNSPSGTDENAVSASPEDKKNTDCNGNVDGAKKEVTKMREWWKEEFFEEMSKKQGASFDKRRGGGGKPWLRSISMNTGHGNTNGESNVEPSAVVDLSFRRSRKRSRRRGRSVGSDVHSGCGGDYLSRELSSTTSMRGTVCYVAPECGGGHCEHGSELLEKADVYSFGVLMLVILSGRRPLHILSSPMKLEKANLVSWCRQLARAGNVLELMDERLDGGYDKDQATKCVLLALLCLQRQPELRPDSTDIVKILDGEMELPPAPVEFSPSPRVRPFPRSSRRAAQPDAAAE